MHVSQRKSAWLRAAVPAAVLALALTACSSDDGSEETSAADESEATEQTEEPPPAEETTEEEEEEEPPADEVEAVAPGTYEYGAGETSEPVPFDDDDASAVLEITFDRVEVGESADLDGMMADPADAEGMVPAHVYYTFANVGGDALEFSDPAYESTITAGGSMYPPLIDFGGPGIPGGCPDDADMLDIAVGESAEGCTSVLMPEGAQPEQITWAQSDGQHELVWTAS
jgi:hypothetical protein